MECCLLDIRAWLLADKLKVRGSPGNNQSNNSLSKHNCLKTENRTLGVVLDQRVNMQNHVQEACRAAMHNWGISPRWASSFHGGLRWPWCTRSPPADSAMPSYMVFLHETSPSSSVCRTQRPALWLAHADRYGHITPILRGLHWLPVEKWIVFKILMVTYRALHDLSLDYIWDSVLP